MKDKAVKRKKLIKSIPLWMISIISMIAGAVLTALVYLVFIPSPHNEEHPKQNNADNIEQEAADFWNQSVGEDINNFVRNNIFYIDDGAFTIDKATMIGKYDERGAYSITGVIESKASRSVDGISLLFLLFDENDNIIGEVYSEIGRLNPGETRRFRTESYKYSDILRIKRFELRHAGPYGFD